MANTFDPAAKGAAFVLSNGNLTARINANATQHCRTLSFKSTGKWYAEVKIDINLNFCAIYVGIAKNTSDVSNRLGQDTAGFAYVGGNFGAPFDGAKFTNSAFSGYASTYGNGDVIGILFDADAHTLGFSKNGVDLGVAFSGLSGSFCAAFGFQETGGGPEQGTINFGESSSLSFGPPAGYSIWGIPPDPSHGNATVALEKFTAFGRRQAVGQVTLQPFTAVGGYHGLGAAVMRPLQISGSGGPRSGTVTLEPMTVAGSGHQASFSLSVLQPFSAQGTGHVSSINAALNDLLTLQLDAAGETGFGGVQEGIIPLPTLEASNNGAENDVPLLQINAFLITGDSAQLVGTLPILTNEATGFLSILATGASTFPALTLEAVGLGENQGAFSGKVPKIYTVAVGFSGGVASLAAQVPVLSLTGIGYGPYVGTVDLILPPIHLDADGFSAVAAALRTWVLNLRKKGLTEYSNFAFNSYAEYRGTILAAGAAGILKLSAVNNDAGTAIAAQVRTGAESFGTSYNKRVPRIYVGYSTDGAMQFSTITSQDGKRTYLLPHNGITKIQQRRVPVGRGPKSPYWQYECTNVAGSDFLLEHVQVYPEKSSRRVV